MDVLLYIGTKLLQQDSIVIRPSFIFLGVVFYVPNRYTIHAEKDAIRKIKNKNILSECKIYIGRIINNKIENSGPCSMCSDLICKYKLNYRVGA
jgi:hypothetical protein